MLPSSVLALPAHMRVVLVLAGFLVAAGAAAGGSQRVDVSPSLVHPSMRGIDIFEFYCAPCHGRDLRGSGPTAAALARRPPDLTRLATANGGVFPRGRVRSLIAGGPDDPAAHGSRDMPVWGPIFRALDPTDTLADERIGNVVAYIETMQRK
jgi:mono/diheme cytochrome c family protein